MKKIYILILSLLLIFSLVSCSSSRVDYSGQELVAKVTKISGNNVTVELGTLTSSGDMNQMDSSNTTPPEISNGGEGTSNDSNEQSGTVPPDLPDNSNTENQNTDGTTPPEIPNGGEGTSNDSNGQSGTVPPDLPDNSNTENQNLDGTTPPEKPDGETNTSNSNEQAGTSPEKPDESSNEDNGGMNDFTMTETFESNGEVATFNLKGAEITIVSSNESTSGSISDITVDSIITLVIGENNKVTSVTINESSVSSGSNSNSNAGFGGSSTVTQGSANTTISTDETIDSKSYESDGDDENALRIDGATVTLTDITVSKTGGESSNTENGDFYGVNAALLATNGAQVTIKDSEISSNAKNGNGVFSYGSGTVVNISDSKITTHADNSGGIQTTGGGTTNATNLTIETDGNSAAAIRSDRGGGTVNVTGGSYTTNGYNSPACYSTATITISDATLTATNSEALVIEGKNSITISDSVVSGNMSDTKGTSSDENVHMIFVYQSMSGDAEVGTSNLDISDSELICNNGDVFHFTNTSAVLNLRNVKLTNYEKDGYLISITGNDASHGWGTAGSNGANVVATFEDQTIEGDIICDTISTLDLTLSEKSTFTGTLNIVDNEEGGSAVSNNITVTIEKGSTWNLTGNSYITSIENNGTINFNGYSITLADGTVLK